MRQIIFKHNKILTTLSVLICFLAFLFLSQSVLAEVTGVASVKEGLSKTADTAGVSKNTDLPGSLGKTINYFFGILGVVFLIIILVGGYLWLTAGGNEEKVGKAKAFIINGINGMIVIFLAYALVYTMLAALGGAVGETVSK